MAYTVRFNFSWPGEGHQNVGTYKKRADAREILIALAEFHYPGCWQENSFGKSYMRLEHVDTQEFGSPLNIGFILEEEGL